MTPKELEVVMAAIQSWFVNMFIYVMHPINELHQYKSISNQCVIYLKYIQCYISVISQLKKETQMVSGDLFKSWLCFFPAR